MLACDYDDAKIQDGEAPRQQDERTQGVGQRRRPMSTDMRASLEGIWVKHGKGFRYLADR